MALDIITWKKDCEPKNLWRAIEAANPNPKRVQYKPETTYHEDDFLSKATDIVIDADDEDIVVITISELFFMALRATIRTYGLKENKVYFYIEPTAEPEVETIDRDGRLADMHNCFRNFDDLLDILL